MLAATSLAVARIKNLFAAVMLFSIYSLLSANIFIVLDAVDVAFTEAAVGAGISTVLMLGTLVMTGYKENKPARTRLIPIIVVVLTGATLVYGTLDLPPFGAADNPVHTHIAPRYLQDSAQEIGIPNAVTSVLASYRGFDTFGETVVVFTALIGVLTLLGVSLPPKTAAKNPNEYQPQPILPIMAKILIPYILLFALYVQFHGDFGPGGGFQAGVIFAAGFILYALTFGLRESMQLVSPRVLRSLAAIGVLLYGGTGVVSFFLKGNFLNYSVLANDPLHGQHYGIIIIELGVGITVASVILSIYYAFMSRSKALSTDNQIL